MRLGRSIALAIAITAALAQTALAVPRHASPTGAGTACTSVTPCSFAEAVQNAADADEVIVASGTYNVGAIVQVSATGLTIRGAAGPDAKPVIQWTGAATTRMLQVNVPAVVRDLVFRGATTGTTPIVGTNGIVAAVFDRIVVEQTSTGLALIVAGADVRNSAIRSTGDGVIAAGTMTNTTILAPTAGRTALRVSAAWAVSPARLVVRNSILRGGAGGWDLSMDNGGQPTFTTIVDTDSSNYDPARVFSTGTGTLILTAGTQNQSAAPVFAGTGLADFARQAANSPTIDRGSSSVASGTGDVDGDARVVDAVDIGADEFVPAPAASSTTVGAIGQTTAAVSGTIDTKTRVGTVRFEYGTTTAYGMTSPDQSRTGATSAATTLTGLTPGTTYNVRVVVTTDRGTAFGPNATFATTALTPPVALGRLALLPTHVRTGRAGWVRFSLSRAARVTVRIERLAAGRVRSGTCDLTARTGTACTKWVTRGTLRSDVAPSSTARVRILAKVGGRALSPGRYRLTVSAKSADGAVSTTRRTILVVTR